MKKRIFCALLPALLTGLCGWAPPAESQGDAAAGIVEYLLAARLGRPEYFAGPARLVGGSLDTYIAARPLDEERFAGYPEYVRSRLLGVPSRKTTPEELAARLESIVRDPGGSSESIESKGLALFARYHARKSLAGAGLALFYATGEAGALNTARIHAAAAVEAWERLLRLTGDFAFVKKILAPEDAARWRQNQALVARDLGRLREEQDLLERYGLFDLGLIFGPISSGHERQEPPRKGRFGLLSAEMIYTRQRGYGWSAGSSVRSSPIPAFESLQEDPPNVPPSFLRGDGASTLLIDLADGDYRVTARVENQSELAGAPFRLRAADGANNAGPQILYAAGETGDKWMNVAVTGGRLSLHFVPEAGKDWLVNSLIVARRQPHIAHVPVFEVTPGSRTTISATITAPDSASEAELHLAIGGRSVIIPMVSDGSQFSGSIAWPAAGSVKEARYFLTARDRAGHEARWPASDSIAVKIEGQKSLHLQEQAMTSIPDGSASPLFSPGFAERRRRRAWIQGARREGSAGVLTLRRGARPGAAQWTCPDSPPRSQNSVRNAGCSLRGTDCFVPATAALDDKAKADWKSNDGSRNSLVIRAANQWRARARKRASIRTREQ